MWTLVAVGIGALALLALTFLLDHLSRRRCAARNRGTLHVALLLSQQDEGLRLLAANVDRPAPWWATTPPGQLERIDEALKGWGTVAKHIADGDVDLSVVLDTFGRRIVAMWEDAYTYVEERHLALWEPLLDLYVDAWEAGHGDHRSLFDELAEEGTAVTPDELPEVEALPADLLTPLLAGGPVTASAGAAAEANAEADAEADAGSDAVPGDSEADRLTVIQAALQPITATAADIPAPPVRRAVTARDVDGPAELLIDLIGTTSGRGVDGPLPRAVHR